MSKKANIVIIIMLLLVTQACHENVSRQKSGSLIGGVTGALIGSQFGVGEGKIVAVAIGSLAGSMIGEQMGQELDKQDKKMLQDSSHQALEYAPSGRVVEWKNPDSGNYGTIMPVKTYREHQHYCREYVQEVIIAGKKEKAHGKACRQPDGNWRIVQ